MTRLLFFHTAGDPAEAEFVEALAQFCGRGDQWKRVDYGVYAPKGSPDATYPSAFHSFDRNAFVKQVQSILWDFPTFVSAMIRPANALLFEPIDLGMADFLERDAGTATRFGWGFELPPRQREFAGTIYPAILKTRGDRIRDSLVNPYRIYRDIETLGEVATEGEWVFECIEAYQDIRTNSAPETSSRSALPAAGGSTTEVRRVYAHGAFQGILVRLECFIEVTAIGADRRNALDEKKIGPRDRFLIDGVIRVLVTGSAILRNSIRAGLYRLFAPRTTPTEANHERRNDDRDRSLRRGRRGQPASNRRDSRDVGRMGPTDAG